MGTMRDKHLADLLDTVPTGKRILDADRDGWERVDNGWALLNDNGTKRDAIFSSKSLIEYGYGPFTLTIDEDVFNPEPKVLTVDDVKPGAVVSFTYTWKVVKDGGANVHAGTAGVQKVVEWINDTSKTAIQSSNLVTPAPDPIDEKVVALYDYAKDNNFILNDYQVEFFAGYLRSLEDK